MWWLEIGLSGERELLGDVESLVWRLKPVAGLVRRGQWRDLSACEWKRAPDEHELGRGRDGAWDARWRGTAFVAVANLLTTILVGQAGSTDRRSVAVMSRQNACI